MTTTITRPPGLSWLESRIFDALVPSDQGKTLTTICRTIEANEAGYRTTHSSVSRLLSDLVRRGIVAHDQASRTWTLVAETSTAVTSERPEPRRNRQPAVSNSALRAIERRCLRAIREEQPCSRACLARALAEHTLHLGRALTRLQALGLIEQNGAAQWMTTAAGDAI